MTSSKERGEFSYRIILIAVILLLIIIAIIILLRRPPRPVANIPPVADFTWSAGGLTADNVEPIENEAVQFIDNSYDPDGHIVSWLWDFGDNSYSTERNPSHVYAEAGEYRVTLRVTDNAGGEGSRTKTIRVRPSGFPRAFFTFHPPNPTILDTVQFIDNSYDPDGQIVSWLWDFGDGSFSTSQNPSHIFQADGTYTVRLTVTDNDGKSSTFERTVAVSPPPPGSIFIIYWDMGIGEGLSDPMRYGHPNNGRHLVLSEIYEGCGCDPNRSWMFEYTNIAGGWAGFYCEFRAGPTDISDYENLVFWVRGKEGDEDFEIIVEDNVGAGGKVRISDYARVTKSWQRVVIPLRAFGEGLSSIRIPWNIAFSDGVTGKNVTVYIDYVLLVRKVVVGRPPVASFTYTPAAPTTEDNIRFTDNSYDPDGHIVSWFWQFGDGTTSSERNPTKRYSAPGTYTVTLTVTDNSGNSSSKSVSITVTAPSGPPPPGPTPPPPPAPGEITLTGMRDLSIPINGSSTVTQVALTNGTGQVKTLRVVCDAWDVSGGKLWSNIYTEARERVFVDGVAYPLTVGPGETKYLRVTVGTTSSASVGDSFILHLAVEDW